MVFGGLHTPHRWVRLTAIDDRPYSEDMCALTVRHFLNDDLHDLNFNVNNIQMAQEAYSAITLRRPDIAQEDVAISLLHPGIVQYATQIILYILAEKMQRIDRYVNRVLIDVFVYGTLINIDHDDLPEGFMFNGRREQLKLCFIEILPNTSARDIVNSIEEQIENLVNIIELGLQNYDDTVLFDYLAFYVRPQNMLFGCGNGETKVIDDHLVYFPNTKNKENKNKCFLGCIQKKLNLKIGQKVKYYSTPKYNIRRYGHTKLTPPALKKQPIFINFPINLENIEKFSEIFRMNIIIVFIRDDNTKEEFKYLNGEKNEDEFIKNNTITLLSIVEEDNFHLGLILKHDPQLFCSICEENHSLSKSKVSCMIKSRNNMFQKLRTVDGVDTKNLVNRLKLNTFKKYSKNQYFVPCDFKNKKNTQEDYSVNEVQAFDGAIFWDLEAYDSGEKNLNCMYLEGQKPYAVGAAFSVFRTPPSESDKIEFEYYKDWYGADCIDQFLMNGILNYVKDIGNYFKDMLSYKDKKKKIQLNLISFNGAGYDNHFLMDTLMSHLVKEDSPIQFIPESIVSTNGRIIGMKFFFKETGIKIKSRSKNFAFDQCKKRKDLYEAKRDVNGRIHCFINRRTKEKIYDRIIIEKDIGEMIVLNVWDLAQFVMGSLASCGKSFGVPLENLKTIFPHRLIRSPDVVSNDLMEVTWHHFNPEDFNNKKKAKEIQKIYGLDPFLHSSTVKINVFPLIKDYLKKDVMTLAHIFSRFAYEIHAEFNGFNVTTMMTGSQLSYKLWLIDAHIRAEKSIEHAATTLEALDNDMRNEKIDEIRADFIPTLVPSAKEYDFIKESYTGGRTYPKERHYNSKYFNTIMENCEELSEEIFKYDDGIQHKLVTSVRKLSFKWTNEFTFDDIQDDVLYLDVNSLYPFVMAHDIDVPTGFYMGPIPLNEISKINDQFHTEGLNCNIGGVFHCLLDTKGYVEHPLIRTKLKNGQNIWTYGKQETILTNKTIKYLIYKGFDLEILGGVRWSKTGNYLRDYILNIYNLRKEAKKDGKAAKSNTLKLIMNGLYGKFAQRILTNVITLVTQGTDYMNFNFNLELDQFFIKDDKLHILVGKNDYHKIDAELFLKKEKPIVLASCITAASRLWMQEYFDKIGRILYTDTDSLFALREDVTKVFGDDLTRTHDSICFPGQQLKIDSSELGALKNELSNDEKIIGTVFAGAKFYGYITINREGEINYELKIKGIPQSQLYQQDLMEIFQDPTQKKNISYFQMKKAGIVPHAGMDCLSITRNVSNRTINQKLYSSMRYNNNNKYESYSYQELCDPNVSEEIVIDNVIDYSNKKESKNKFVPVSYDAKMYLQELHRNSAFYPDPEVVISNTEDNYTEDLINLSKESEYLDFTERMIMEAEFMNDCVPTTDEINFSEMGMEEMTEYLKDIPSDIDFNF
jgi:hypothetical protein